MILLELFWSFCKIGFTSFGGMSMVPFINSEMLDHGWMTATEVSDIVAIAEMTPGPLGLNCATFAGTRVAGLPGSLCATLGILMPTFLICSIAAAAFEKFHDSSLMKKAMFGIRPGTFGLIFGVFLSLCRVNYITPNGTFSPTAIFIGIVCIIALFKYKLSIPLTILLSAVLGLILIQ